MAAGARLRRIARLPVGPSLRFPIDLLAGGWAVAVLTLACGLAGAFHPLPLMGVVVVLAATGRWRRSSWRWRPIVAVAVPSLLLLPVALAPPFFYDALVYHLGLPWQGLLEGRLSPHPENLFAAFPPFAQLLYAAPLAIGLERVPAILHLASFFAAGAALIALARRFGAPRWMAFLAGAALPVLPAVALVPALPAAEGWLLAAVLSAFAALARDGGRVNRAGALLAGFLCGVGCAARLQGMAWSGIILAIVALRWRGSTPVLARAGAGWLAGSAPWWIKNAILLGNPIAPLGWRREGIETLWRDAGSQMHLASNVAGFLSSIGEALQPHLAYAAPLALAALLALRGKPDRRSLRLAAAALAGTFFWAATGILPRFLAPALALVLALAAASGTTRPGRWAGGLSLAMAMALGLAFTAQQMNRWGGFDLVLEEPGSDMRGIVTNNPMPAFNRAEYLTKDARVLFIGEPRGYRFPRWFVAPSQHDVSPLREPIEDLPSAEAVREWLISQGYNHLLVNFRELARLAPRYPLAPWRTEAGRLRFDELLKLVAPPVVESGEVAIFALR